MKVEIQKNLEDTIVGGYRYPHITSMEKFEIEGFDSLRGAMLKLGDKVIVTQQSYLGINTVVIYEFIEEDMDYIESRISLIKIFDEGFEDSGAAIKFALKNI